MKFLILGNGYLGNKFLHYLNDAIMVKDRIERVEDVSKNIALCETKPDYVINCIGKTGQPNIDWCEDHQEETFFSNVYVPTCVAIACKKFNIPTVHISSGCIYEGSGPFTEEDPPNFGGSFYSRTKIATEGILKGFDNVLQLRIRMPLDNDDSPKNLINKLLKYPKIISVPNSITVVPDFLRIAKELMAKNARGIFNVANKGCVTQEEILRLYGEVTGKKTEYKVIPLDELKTLTKTGRSNCILSIEKLERLGIEVPSVTESLKKLFKEVK